jgi:hypothetical protein
VDQAQLVEQSVIAAWTNENHRRRTIMPSLCLLPSDRGYPKCSLGRSHFLFLNASKIYWVYIFQYMLYAFLKLENVAKKECFTTAPAKEREAAVQMETLTAATVGSSSPSMIVNRRLSISFACALVAGGGGDLGHALNIVERSLKLEFGHPTSLLWYLWRCCAGQE